MAVRKAGAVSYLFGDHLGSTSVTANASGARTGELWYKPWGESRGTPFGTTPTTYRFTGQREDASLGLYFYGARYYDAYEAGGCTGRAHGRRVIHFLLGDHLGSTAVTTDNACAVEVAALAGDLAAIAHPSRALSTLLRLIAGSVNGNGR